MSATHTTNLGLNKPNRQDYVSVVTDINDNMDILDSKIGAVPSGETVEGQIGAKVPTTRKINNKALSSDVTIMGSDIPMNSLDNTKLDVAVGDLKSAFSKTLKDVGHVYDDLTYTIGGLNILNGSEMDANNRIRTSFIKFEYEIINITLKSDWTLIIFEYDAGMNYVVPSPTPSYQNFNGKFVTINTSHYYRFLMKKSDDPVTSSDDPELVIVVQPQSEFYKEIVSDADNIKNDIGKAYSFEYELGGINGSTGEDTTDTKRMRSKFMQFISDSIFVSVDGSWGWYLFEYNEEKVYQRALTSDYVFTNRSVDVNPKYYYRFSYKTNPETVSSLQNPPVFSAYTEAKSETVQKTKETVTVKPSWLVRQLHIDDGTFTDSTTRYASGFLSFVPGTRVTVNFPTNANLQVGVTDYGKNGRKQSYTNWKTAPFTFTSKDYAVIAVKNTSETLPSSSIGDVSISYEIDYGKKVESIDDCVLLYLLRTDYSGDCAIIKAPDGTTIMSDCGESSSVVQNDIIDKMDLVNSDHIDVVIISHYHSDHVGNFGWLIEKGFIDSNTIVYIPKQFESEIVSGFDSNAVNGYNTFTALITENSIPTVKPNLWDVVRFGDMSIMFFNTDHSEIYVGFENETINKDYNMCSMGFRLEYGSMSYISIGDAVGYPWQYYYSRMRKCTVYKAHHHSVDSTTTTELLDDVYGLRFMSAIFPDFVITSLGHSLSNATPGSGGYDRFVGNTKGLQQWCENNIIPNYVVGTLSRAIGIEFTKYSYRMTTDVMRHIRSEWA